MVFTICAASSRSPRSLKYLSVFTIATQPISLAIFYWIVTFWFFGGCRWYIIYAFNLRSAWHIHHLLLPFLSEWVASLKEQTRLQKQAFPCTCNNLHLRYSSSQKRHNPAPTFGMLKTQNIPKTLWKERKLQMSLAQPLVYLGNAPFWKSAFEFLTSSSKLEWTNFLLFKIHE